jgi:hypothetical protein
MERYAVTGFVPDKIAHTLRAEHSDSVEIYPERGAHEVFMRVKGSDISEVRRGSSEQGQTLVQLLLRDGAVVETVIRSTADVKGVARFHDLTISRLTASATVKVIEA